MKQDSPCKEQAPVHRVAAIDLGTVSSRLALAEVREGTIVSLEKHTVITDLGEGVDATHRFCDAAVERVVAACEQFVREAHAFGAACTVTTLTSAARDAENAETLLVRLRNTGLTPQVIPGEIEARLTFYGVAHDFPGERIVVADSGGGSTELVVGTYDAAAGALRLEQAESLNIGCRRVTDRFLPGDPPRERDVERAAAWSAGEFAPYWRSLASLPDRLVAVGGTVTTLVALAHELEPYDASFVHLHDLSLAEIEACLERMHGASVAEIAQIKGIQPKRAHVIRAGALIICELMRTGGYEHLTVSENSLLAGMVSTVGEFLDSGRTAIGWQPELGRGL